MFHPPLPTSLDNQYLSNLAAALTSQGVSVCSFSLPAARDRNHDLLHVHWPENYYGFNSVSSVARRGSRIGLAELVRARAKIPMVWTVHNIEPHDGRFLQRSSYHLAARLSSASIHLTETGRRLATDRYAALARIPSIVTAHGMYRASDPTVSKEEARRTLGLDEELEYVLAIGQIRAYKGILPLVQMFMRADKTAPRLVVAGRCNDQELKSFLTEHQARSDRIIFREGLLTEVEWEMYMRASDTVVLPYEKFHNSGVALSALSHGRPVILPRTPISTELMLQFGKEWVYLRDGESLLDLLKEIKHTDRPEFPLTPSAYEWDKIAQDTIRVYNMALGT